MSLSMPQNKREAFLADLHVGVISIEQDGSPPLSVPIWYDYTPATGLWIITADSSQKAELLNAAGRFTLVAQSEEPPNYCYVSVEGPVVEKRPAQLEADVAPMARRYFGEELGNAYAKATGAEGQTVYVMRPERWRTVDYGQMASA